MIDAFNDYLDAHYEIKKVEGGRQWQLLGAHCPFCQEQRADLRLYYNHETGLGICYHCGAGFNPLKFVAAFEGVSIGKAKAILGEVADTWVRTQEAPATPVAPGLVFPACDFAANSPEAMAYLAGRGFDERLVRHFRLHVATANLTIGERTFYTDGRLVIPIFSPELVSWQARDMTGKAKQKYLFPPGFKGSEYLFNLNALRPNAPLIISEGVFDVFGWWRAGFTNVTATFGKKISEEQVTLLSRLNPSVLYMAWDDDALFEKHEFVKQWSHRFKEVRVVTMGGRDADEISAAPLAKILSEAAAPSWSEKILQAL